MAKCENCKRRFKFGETRCKTEDNNGKIWTLCKQCNDELAIKWFDDFKKSSGQRTTKQTEIASKIYEYLKAKKIPAIGYSFISFRGTNIVNIRFEINEKRDLDDFHKEMHPLIEEMKQKGIKIDNFKVEVGTFHIGEKNNITKQDVSYLDLGVEID